MNDAQIKHMVNRFLAWKLPETFSPDGGVVFKRTHGEGTPYPGKYEPSGTNLLNADEAKAMVLHMLEGLPGSASDRELHTRSAIAAAMISGETR